MRAPPRQAGSLRATKGSSAGARAPSISRRWGKRSSEASSEATSGSCGRPSPSTSTVAPSRTLPSICTTRWSEPSGGLRTRSALDRAACGSPSGAGAYASRSSSERSVNSQPRVFCVGSGGAAPPSANRALHLQLDQAVQLDGVLHRKLLGDRLDETVDDHLGGLLLVQPAGLEVEDLLLADLRDGCLVTDVDVVLADPDRRVGVGAGFLVEQEGVADHLRLRLGCALGDLEKPAVAGPALVLGDRLGEDRRRRLRGGVDDLAAGVLMLAGACERDREDLAVGPLAEQVDRRVLHGQLRAEV